MVAAEPAAPGRRRWRVPLLLGLAAVAALLAWSLAGRQTAQRYPAGISVGGILLEEPAAAMERDLDLVRRAGATWVRLDVNWAVVQDGGPESYDWSATDRALRAAGERGLRVLAVLAYTPVWARPPGTEANAPPPPDEYAAFARRAVARYAPLGVRAWEVWNEPNNSASWAPGADPAAYARLLVAGAAAIRAGDPDATVVSGGLSPAETNGRDVDPVTFLQAVYAAGGGGAFDAVGHHPYTFPLPPGRSRPDSAWRQMAETTPSLRSVMAANGDGGKEIWATEFGAPTGGEAGEAVGEGAQATSVSDALRLWRSSPWAGVLFVYSMRDLGRSPTDRESSFGLTRSDGSPKPAFGAFRKGTQAHPPGGR